MPEGIALVEWIVKTALLDESISTDHLVSLMKEKQLNSTVLLNYIDDDRYWPVNKPDTIFNVKPEDEKYILNFQNPNEKLAGRIKREKLRKAVEQRFYTGHRFGEWLI